MSTGKSLVAEARELLSAVTPWPWTTKPGTFWICDVGHTGCGVWSTAYPPLGEPFPHAEQEADAALLARAPELISALCDEVDRLTKENELLRWDKHAGQDLINAARAGRALIAENIALRQVVGEALQYVNDIGAHAPIVIGGEAELAEKLQSAISPKGSEQ